MTYSTYQNLYTSYSALYIFLFYYFLVHEITLPTTGQNLWFSHCHSTKPSSSLIILLNVFLSNSVLSSHSLHQELANHGSQTTFTRKILLEFIYMSQSLIYVNGRLCIVAELNSYDRNHLTLYRKCLLTALN